MLAYLEIPRKAKELRFGKVPSLSTYFNSVYVIDGTKIIHSVTATLTFDIMTWKSIDVTY